MTEIQVFDQQARLIVEAREQRARADRLEKSLAEVRADRDDEHRRAIAAEAALAVVVDRCDEIRGEVSRAEASTRFVLEFMPVASIDAILDGKADHFAGSVFVRPDTGEKWDIVLQRHGGVTPIELLHQRTVQLDAALAMLRELEWSADGIRCPVCRAYKPGSHFAQLQFHPTRVGHDGDCKLAALVAKTEEAANGPR